MSIPKPRKGQSENEYISECIAFLVKEGKDTEQASAICYSNWKESKMQSGEPKIITIKK